MQKENLFFFSFPSVSNLSKAPFRQYFPFPLSLRLVFPVIVPVSFSLQKPCQSVRAFPADPEKYENF